MATSRPGPNPVGAARTFENLEFAALHINAGGRFGNRAGDLRFI